MSKYVVKRFIQSFLTVILITVLVFILLRMMPKDYYFTEEEIMRLNAEQKQEMLLAAGLLDPLPKQLSNFLSDLLKGDLGVSRRLKTGKPIGEIIGPKMMTSMKLGLASLAISLGLGVTLGVFQAIYKGKLLDHLGIAFTVFANAVPSLISYSLILVLGSRVFGLPSMYSTRNVVRSSILPVICLSLVATSSYMIWMRRYMVDEMNKDYVKLAKLKGLSQRAVVFRHVLKNAFVPLAQFLPGAVLYTLGGSLLVERFYSVPGIGTLLTDAINRYDTNIVQILVMFYATLGVAGVFLGDLLMVILDPRISLVTSGEER